MGNNIYLMIFFNLLNFIGFIVGKYFLKKNFSPNFMSTYSTLLGIFLIIYLITNLWLSLYLFNNNKYPQSLIALIFVCLPFIYGNLSNYRTADAYINIQIFTFVINSIYIGGIKLQIF